MRWSRCPQCHPGAPAIPDSTGYQCIDCMCHDVWRVLLLIFALLAVLAWIGTALIDPDMITPAFSLSVWAIILLPIYAVADYNLLRRQDPTRELNPNSIGYRDEGWGDRT